MPDSTKIASPEPALSSTKAPASTAASPGSPKRVVVTRDQLLSIFEERLQQIAEKAVASASTSQLNPRIDDAVTAVMQLRATSIRQFEEHCLQYSRELVASLGEQILGRLQADLAPIEIRVQEQLASLTQAQASAQEVENKTREGKIVLTEALNLAQTQAHELQNSFIEGLRETTDRTAAETRHFETLLTERAAEIRASFEAQQSAFLAELARSSDQQIDQFRRQMEVVVKTATDAISAANEQSRALFDAFAKDTAQRLREAAQSLHGVDHKETTT